MFTKSEDLDENGCYIEKQETNKSNPNIMVGDNFSGNFVHSSEKVSINDQTDAIKRAAQKRQMPKTIKGLISVLGAIASLATIYAALKQWTHVLDFFK